MKDRTLAAMMSLVSILFALTACGSSGGSGSAAGSAPLVKDAVVTVAFDPGSFSGNAKKITSGTNYIQLYVTQWQAGDLNALTVVNTDASHVLTPSNPSATLTLYSTYTRICAAQYAATPSSSTPPTEAECSFGILASGNNTVNLTMLNGTWTLSKIYNGIGSVVLSAPTISPATAGSVSYGVYDGTTTNVNANPLQGSTPAQSLNNWGSIFNLQVEDSSGNIITGLTDEQVFTDSFFNYGDNGPSVVGRAKAPSPTGQTNVVIGGSGRGVDSDGFMRETKNIILYPPKSTTPVIAYPTSSMEVQDKNGNIVTGTVLANCQLQVLSGSSIQGCGITEIKSNGADTSSSDIQTGTSTNYNYKVTGTESVAGADICYTNNAGATRDSSGNIICYDYDMITSPSGGISCPSGGTYNSTAGRCEYSLSSTCTNSINSGSPKSNTTYNTTSQSCTTSGIGYFLNLNSTPLTLTAN